MNDVVIPTAFVTLQQSVRLVGVATTSPPVMVGAVADEHGMQILMKILSEMGHWLHWLH